MPFLIGLVLGVIIADEARAVLPILDPDTWQPAGPPTVTV